MNSPGRPPTGPRASRCSSAHGDIRDLGDHIASGRLPVSCGTRHCLPGARSSGWIVYPRLMTGRAHRASMNLGCSCSLDAGWQRVQPGRRFDEQVAGTAGAVRTPQGRMGTDARRRPGHRPFQHTRSAPSSESATSAERAFGRQHPGPATLSGGVAGDSLRVAEIAVALLAFRPTQQRWSLVGGGESMRYTSPPCPGTGSLSRSRSAAPISSAPATSSACAARGSSPACSTARPTRPSSSASASCGSP